MMKKIFMTFTVILCCTMTMMTFSACSDDNSNNSDDGNDKRKYSLNQKIVQRRHCHGLQKLANDMLNLQFEQIVFEYTSVGPDLKTPVQLTGVISMNAAVYNKQQAPFGLMLYNEFTTAKHQERTSQNEYDDVALYMNKFQNIIAVSADLYGWTLTENKPQAYCCPEITAVETIDAWDAAMAILKEEGYDINGLPTFNVGYSSGGFSAIAVQRYTDENRPDLHWDMTAAGAAPFNINTVYKDNTESEISGYACSFPLVVVAYKETYGLDFEYSEVFQKPLCDNIQKWILSKDYNTWEINGLIAGNKELADKCPVDKILTPEARNLQSKVGQVLTKKFRENSLCGEGQTWQPSKTTQFMILHSKGDKYMDWKVGKEMADYLKSKGCKVSEDFSDYGNHVNYGLFIQIGQTMMDMLPFMKNADEIADEVENEIVNQLQGFVEAMDDTPIEGI